jgi:hypothetical protein
MITEKEWKKFVDMVQSYGNVTEKQIIKQLLRAEATAEQYAIDIREGY